MDSYKAQQELVLKEATDDSFQNQNKKTLETVKNYSEFQTKFSQVLQYINENNSSQISIAESIIFVLNHSHLFSIFDEMIPNIIQSGFYNLILANIDEELKSHFLRLIRNMCNCNNDNLILLLQNKVMDILLDSIFSPDLEVCKCAFEILDSIISRNYFFYTLVFSTHIFEIILNFFVSNKDQNELIHPNFDQIFGYCLSFIQSFVDILPELEINQNGVPYYHELFETFLAQCNNPSIFDPVFFSLILESQIDLSEPTNLFPQLLLASFDHITQTNSIPIINRFLLIIFELLHKDYNTIDIFLYHINIFELFNHWIQLEQVNDKTLLLISKIYEVLFYVKAKKEIDKYLITDAAHNLFQIFDSFPVQNEELEIATISALRNLIDFDCSISVLFLSNQESIDESSDDFNSESPEVFASPELHLQQETNHQEHEMDTENSANHQVIDSIQDDFPQDVSESSDESSEQSRVDFIINQILEGKHKVHATYIRLLLTICLKIPTSLVNVISQQLLTEDVIAKISACIEIKEGNSLFSAFVLDCYDDIFMRCINSGDSSLLELFELHGGLDSIMELMDKSDRSVKDKPFGEEEEHGFINVQDANSVSQKAKLLYSKYFEPNLSS